MSLIKLKKLSLNIYDFKKIKLPVAEHISRNGLYLPSGLSISASQQKYVINKIKKIISKYL